MSSTQLALIRAAALCEKYGAEVELKVKLGRAARSVSRGGFGGWGGRQTTAAERSFVMSKSLICFTACAHAREKSVFSGFVLIGNNYGFNS